MEKVVTIGVLSTILVLGFAMWGMPQYNVYSKRLSGMAEYEQAQQNRKVRILESEAKLEANKLDALAEIERAKGVAEANRIIADSLGGSEGYLRWRYIEMLEQSADNQIIYIPTEATLPLLEAGKR